jgi:hypothetical protein
MDRRDRVTVLACDLECRTMPGGWHAPGAACAHEVDAFLAGATADGATDLVGAVRAAAEVSGRAGDHDLRVVLLSDGVATAGVRGASRVSAEVAAHLSDPRAEVVAVPIGSDADVDTLSEIAQGGGGAVVPYGAGQALEAAALDVLSATYGATLRDVQLTLPDGLHDLAPGVIPPLRAGAETLLAARMRGDHAAGDLVLRGRLAGEPYEARWPVDVRATVDEGNAWAARTWAAGRVSDDERAGTEPDRTEAIALSHRFRVPSRLTSLLVLESEAMFRAFRIERSESAFEWTGESESHGTETAPAPDAAEKDDVGNALAGAAGSASLGVLSGLAGAEAKAAPRKASRAEEPMRPSGDPMDSAAAPSLGQGFAGGGGGFAQAPAPAPTTAATPPFGGPPGRRGQWMRRVWFRTAAISGDGRSPVDASKLETARAALADAPDLRQRHADLARLLTRAGSAGELEAVADRWSTRDPLDPDLLTARAAARAWRGDRVGALRILSGMLASPSTSSAAQADIASALARAEERAVQPVIACALRVAAAESRPEDVATVAAAVACQRGQGDEASAARWIAAAKDEPTRTRLSFAAAKLLAAPRAEDAMFGDVSVDATWDDRPGVDLDIAVIDPSGRRLSWASAASRVRARDCTSRLHEALGVSSSAAGAFVVEIVRADATASSAPVRGSVRISSLGRTQVVPFVLVGDRQQVARVDVRFDSRLEPVNVWPAW